MVSRARGLVRNLHLTCLRTEGFSVLMFIFTMWIVLQNRRRRRLNHGMVAAACAVLALSTAVRHRSWLRITARADSEVCRR